MKSTAIVLCAVAAVAGFLVLPYLVLWRAPVDYQLYFSQKIFYYHVPAAWVMFLSVFVCGIASIGSLSTRKETWDDLAAAAGDLVVVFGMIVLTTGPIWAKPAWGRY